MSTQSGISPSTALLAAFKDYVNNKHSILLAHIENESIELTKIISGSPDLSQDFNQLRSELSESVAKYIIIKRETNAAANLYTFISYVPDYSPVKDKMLYASSKNTLIKSLGSEYFSDVIFINGLDEITYANYKATISGGDSAGSGLSNREVELQKIKDDEMKTLLQSSSVTAKRQLVTHQNDFSFKFKENTNFAIEELKLYSLNIDLKTEEIFLSNQQPLTTTRDLLTAISPDSPQFNILKYKGKVYFIYSCPSGSKVKERMIYASNKQGVINHFQKAHCVTFAKTFETGDAVELELSELEPPSQDEDSLSAGVNALKFNRPSRPGRRTK
ncbi:hypothetical protein WICPIJ_007472 [Wickerhamomyces pijperi]|uniref:ADF-H domain-containing protein n=1 Tax=Wickerhamomyces pijperi TaxID=599730 RepID=A0A9P8PZY6_WICPI|nr:hypothetical protein WICPIJ_007472 [Wickerhamomyces pijperi]